MVPLRPSRSGRVEREPGALPSLEGRLGARLPAALATALTTLAWDESGGELGEFVLFPNPPAPDLDRFWSGMDYGQFRDLLIEAGYVPFCRWDASFDPVCIDIRGRDPERAPVVSLWHEALLMRGDVRTHRQYAASWGGFLALLAKD